MNEEQFLALLKSGVAPTDSCGKAAAAGPTTQPVSSGSASATDDPPAKRARTELAARANAEGILTFEYQNRYGYRRYSLSDGSHVEVKAADDARIPFKVQTQDTGETEIFIVVNDRVISSIETVEEFAKEQAIANSFEWFGRRIGQEEAETMLKTSLKRDALYPTKLKACTRRATIFAYTTREGETSSGQGAAFLDELVRAHHSLQGLVVNGLLSPTIWATRKAFGVRFYIQNLNLSEHKDKETEKKNQSLEQHVVALFAAAQSASKSPLA